MVCPSCNVRQTCTAARGEKKRSLLYLGSYALSRPSLPLDTLLHHLILADGGSRVQVQRNIQFFPTDHLSDPVPHGETAAQQLRLAGFIAQLRHPALSNQSKAEL